MKLTVEKKMPEAEAAYRELIQLSPVDGYPSYVRFLSRTGRTTEALALLQSDPTLLSQSSLVRARTAVAAGASSTAIELLNRAPVAAEDEFARATLLANQLHLAGRRSDAARVLQSAAVSAGLSASQRQDLFTRVIATGEAGLLTHALPVMIEPLVMSSSMDYEDLRSIVVEAMSALANSPEYGTFHHLLEDQRNTSATAGWLFALSCIRRGDVAGATLALDEWTTRSTTAPEKLICIEELARIQSNDVDRAIKLYGEALKLAPDSDRLRFVLGQMLYRKRAFDECTSTLLSLRFEKLDETARGVFTNLLLSSVAASRPLPELIKTFEKYCTGLSWERLRQVAEAPFVTLLNTKFVDLRALLQARVAEPGAPPELHVLRMSLENRLGDSNAIVEALGAYLAARPTIADAVQEYADAMGQIAYQVATGDPNTSPSTERQKQVADAAAKALWNVIRIRPYAPEPYGKLMEIYRLFGDAEKARLVPLALCDSTTATADDVHLAAYVYATNGYPVDALPLYERAIKLAPEKTRFRLNYAGALSRVGRYSDAEAIYQDVISHGVNGLQFHPHDLLVNSIRLADEHGQTSAHLTFLKSLLTDKSVPQHDLYLLEAAKACVGTGHPDEAMAFIEALKTQYPQHTDTAEDILVQARVAKRDFKGAEQLLAQEEQETTDTAGKVLVRSNLAEVKRAQGQMDAAVEIWTKLAAEFPNDRQATRKFVTAAQVLMESGKLERAEQLLKQYLSLDIGDPDGELLAREVLGRLQKLDVPTESIVQSAMESMSTTSTAPVGAIP
ncbi:MAG: tetratricopeptide repeat protein [Candidatus Sumerlaeaceae bacterium]